MTTLAMTFKNLQDRLTLNYNGPTVTEVAEIKTLINEGYLQFLMDYDWSFVTKTGVVTAAATATGTGTSVAGTLTATASIFYPEHIGTSITITDGGGTDVDLTTTISAYTSPTIVTLTDTTSFAAKALTISALGRADMPSDFAQIIGLPIVNVSTGDRLEHRPPAWIKQQAALNPYYTGQPCYFALEPAAFVVATGQRWKMLMWPYLDTAYSVTVAYRFEVDLLSADGDYPMGGSIHSATILQAALMRWEQTRGNSPGYQTDLYYKTALPRSIAREQAGRASIVGSYRADARERGRPFGTVTYDT